VATPSSGSFGGFSPKYPEDLWKVATGHPNLAMARSPGGSGDDLAMTYLLVVSMVWAFSFGLIKGHLVGLSPSFVSLVRMVLSLVLFLPFLRLQRLGWSRAVQLLLLGSVQYGLMYVLYVASFETLAAHEVALFASFTPLFVVLLDDGLGRVFRPRFAVAALLAVAGALVLGRGFLGVPGAWKGILLMQGSNLCFAVGQVWYRRLGPGVGPSHREYALPYAGAVLATGVFVLLTPGSVPTELSLDQVAVLGYLGVLASGVCFYLWNVGATRTNAGVLAVFNNAKVPLGVLVSLVVFGESASWWRLGVGACLVALALWVGVGRRGGVT